jgi:hypothetical protein
MDALRAAFSYAYNRRLGARKHFVHSERCVFHMLDQHVHVPVQRYAD